MARRRVAHRRLSRVRLSGILAPLGAASTVHGATVRWSARVVGEGSLASVSDAHHADEVLPTASIGKVFLLITTLERIERGLLDGNAPVAVADEDRVADSGLLQHLGGQTLTVLDLCRFVSAVSDNLATNVLLRHVGLDRVAETTARLGFRHSALHDVVRDRRGPEHAPFLSSGCAAELAELVVRIARREVVSPSVSAGVADLLRLNTDLSMVAAALALDPLAHIEADLGLRLFNKTGTQHGTRADIGWVGTAEEGSGVAYAVIARFEDSAVVRRDVLDAMAAVGANIRAVVAGA